MKSDTTFAIEIVDEDGCRTICHRATAVECWRLIDKYQGVSPHWPARGCYVVKTVRTFSRRRKPKT